MTTMNNKNNLINVVTLIFGLLISISANASFTFIGEIETKLPNTSITSLTTDPVAFVKELQAKINTLDSACVFTFDKTLAQNSLGNVPYCYIEWVVPAELATAGSSAHGIPLTYGPMTLGYQVSVFNGSRKQKITIHSDTLIVDVLEPIEPLLMSASSYIGSTWQQGLVTENHNLATKLNAVKIELETRNYDQKVTIEPYGFCIIPENGNFCTIMVGSSVLGSRENNIGSQYTSFNLDAHNAYFAPANITGAIEHTWDYRPPFIEATDAYVVADDNAVPSKTVTMSGITVVITNEIAKVVISSPHSSRNDDWWIPETLGLEFIPDETVLASDPLIVDEHVLFQAADATLLERVNIRSTESPERYGDQWLYEVNMSGVPDGVYKVNVIASDKYQNVTTKVFNELSFIRQKPEVKLFRNYEHMSDGEHFYFTENLIVASFNKYRDSTVVESIEIDGNAIPMSDDRDNVKTIMIDAESLNLQNDTLHNIRVTASDDAGNISVNNYEALYRPIVFNLASSGGDTIYQSVQTVSSKVVEVKNKICDFVPDVEVAKRDATTFKYSCIFRWSAIPAGMEEDYRSAVPVIKGTIQDLGPQTITYNVYLYDHNGNETLVITNTDYLEAEVPPAPIFEFSDDKRTSSGKYPISLDGGLVSTFRVVSVPADITTETGEGDTFRSYERKQNSRQTVMRSSTKAYVPEGDLWDVINVPILSAYDNLPSINTTGSMDAFYIPKRGISVKLTFPDKYALNTETEKVSVELGKYNRRDKSFTYDKSTMGEWDIQLVKMISRSEYEFLPGIKRIGDVQKVDFDIDPNILSEGGGKVFAIASIISPHEDYEQQIETNKLFIRVYKGGELEGQYKYRALMGNIPFTVSLAYKAADREDSIATGDIRWEESTDNVNWTRMAEYDNKYSLRKKIETVSNRYMRVVVVNKFTGVETVAESLNVVAYDKPSLKIVRDNVAFIGEVAKFKLLANEDDARSSEMEIEWSTDNGDTWIPGENLYSLEQQDSENSRYLMARTRLLGEAQLAGDKGWTSNALISYSWIKPRKLTLKSNMPRKVEVGTTFTASAIARAPYEGTESRIRNEWLLGDNVIATNTDDVEIVADAQYINRNNFEIKFRGWLDGQREGTFKETIFKVRTWSYSFPAVSLAVPVSSGYAPNTFKVMSRARIPTSDEITFTSDFYVVDGGDDVGVEPESVNGSIAYFRFEHPGVKVIGYKLSDSRGNEEEVTSMVELFPSMPMEVNLEGTYSNEALRYPLDGSIRANIVIAHPDDKIDTWEWTLVNNDTLEEKLLSGNSRAYVSDLGELGGTVDYTVKLKATTVFGQIGEQELPIFVNENQKPTCTMAITDTTTSIRAEMDCDDSDGKIAKYAWYINGVKLANYQYAITLTKSRIEDNTITIKGEGIDDSFESDSVSIPFNVR
jgi:hypothetical protein